MRARIICIGNRFLAADTAGPLVHDLLAASPLPDGVELVDGGTSGLRLLSMLENCELAIFVDAVSGYRPDSGVVILDPPELSPAGAECNHGSGLATLLLTAPHVLDGPVPDFVVIGIEGPPATSVCEQAASACLACIEAHGLRTSPATGHHLWTRS